MQLESASIILGLSALAWLFYKLVLKNLSRNRHKRMHQLFTSLVRSLVGAGLLFGLFYALHFYEVGSAKDKLQTYLGLVLLLWGLSILVKISRIFAFETLFYNNMRSGVPLLLVNCITFLLSIFALTWLLSQVFNFQLGPVLATSAFFSVVLGLALQDTIGNLFSGLALQFDKPFELGDWIEVHSIEGPQWVGMVHEVSWRATTLIGFFEEVQIIPNRALSSALITNYSGKIRPVIRSHLFRVPYDSPVEEVKAAMLRGLLGIAGIRKDPGPLVLLRDTRESWIEVKLVYFIEDFGAQYITGDKVISQTLAELTKAGFELATNRLELVNPPASTR